MELPKNLYLNTLIYFDSYLFLKLIVCEVNVTMLKEGFMGSVM